MSFDMEGKEKQEALTCMLDLAGKKGYITFDDMMDFAEEKSLSIQTVDWMSNELSTRGIIIYEEEPVRGEPLETDCEEIADFAQSDYDFVYDEVIKRAPELEPLVTEVRSIIPPQRGEIKRLKYQVIEGNEFARARMIEMHMRLAIKIAFQRAEEYGLDIVDTVGDACAGLVSAINKYNPDEHGAFASYASMWMVQSIRRNQNTCRPLFYYPAHVKELFFVAYKILKAKGYFGIPALISRKEAYQLLKTKLSDCSNRLVANMLTAASAVDSLDQIVSNWRGQEYTMEDTNEWAELALEEGYFDCWSTMTFEDGFNLLKKAFPWYNDKRIINILNVYESAGTSEQMQPEESTFDCMIEYGDYEQNLSQELVVSDEYLINYVMLKTRREMIDEVLESLTPREKKVLRLRFGLDDERDRTLEEVGRSFGVTRERIRQIEIKAMKKLRNPLRSRRLRAYYEI